MELIDQLAHVGVAVGEDGRARLVGAVVQRAVELNGIDAHSLAEVNPLIDILQGRGLHDVGEGGELAVQCPWPAQRGVGDAWGVADHLLHVVAHRAEGGGDEACLCAFEAEALVGGSPEVPLWAWQLLHIGLEAQGDHGGAEGLVGLGGKTRGDVHEGEFIELTHCREHLEDDVALRDFHLDLGTARIAREGQGKDVIRVCGAAAIRAPAILLDIGARGGRGKKEVVDASFVVEEPQVFTVVAYAPFAKVVHNADCH